MSLSEMVINVSRSGEWSNMESKNISYSVKVNEIASLTTRSDETESVSRYNGYKPNNVWSDLKHLRAHEHGEHSDPWSEL